MNRKQFFKNLAALGVAVGLAPKVLAEKEPEERWFFNRDLLQKRLDEINSRKKHRYGAATIAKIEPFENGIDITLSFIDHENEGMRSFPVIRHCVMFEDGETMGWIQSVNRTKPYAHSIRVYQTNSDKKFDRVKVGQAIVFFFSYGNPDIV